MCFEEGKSIGAAIGTFNTLQKYYPNSKITAKAVARLGKAYGDIAFYDRASDKLEEYAKKYAGEKDAHDAMNDAVLYRKGLGDDQKAIDDTKYFIKTFGPKNAADAANASFSLTSIYEKGSATRTRSSSTSATTSTSSARRAARTRSSSRTSRSARSCGSSRAR